MKNYSFLFILILTISCNQPDMKFILTEVISLENIPGASGLGINEQHMIIVGDNSPYLYLLDHNANQIDSIIIYPTDNYKDGEITKSLKPDFEALELIKGEAYDEVLIFGSGSRSPQRDIYTHISLSPEPQVETYSLVTFYDQLREMEIMSGHEFNIEAVAFYENKLLLFNRGKNLIFQYDYPDFVAYVKEEIPYPLPIVTEFELPQIKGIEAGFSGATIIPGTHLLLITSSVEDTPNAYDDGEVLGSYICMLDLDDREESMKCYLIEDENHPMQVKVESVAVLDHISNNEVELLMVTDSDGDESLLLKGMLTW